MFVCTDMLRYGTCIFILKLCSYNCQSTFKCKWCLKCNKKKKINAYLKMLKKKLKMFVLIRSIEKQVINSTLDYC